MTDRTGSPTFRLPSGLPLDPGRDQMGNIRHIARETTIPPVLERGDFQEINWEDFSRIMVPPAHARDETIYANIVDTVLMDQVGGVSQYIYTNSSGAIALKSSKSCTPKRVYEEFMKISSRLQPDAAAGDVIVAAVTNYGSTEPTFLESSTFKNTLEARQFKDAIVQCFVPSKGVGSNNRTYVTKYWLDRMAKEHMKTDIVDINSEVSGSSRTSRTAYKDRTNIRLMDKTMEQIVLACRSGHFGARDGGKAVLVGVPTTKADINAADLLVNEKHFIGSIGGSCAPDRDFPRFLEWEENGDLALDKMVTERFSIDQINDATDALANGEIAGRAILEF